MYGFTADLLQKITHDIAEPVCVIINKCIQQGKFLSKLKIAKVIRIHKKEDPNNCSNYRPISILPVISKIMEALLKERIVNYIERNNFLSQSQHGFRKSKSTSTAMMEVIGSIMEAF